MENGPGHRTCGEGATRGNAFGEVYSEIRIYFSWKIQVQIPDLFSRLHCLYKNPKSLPKSRLGTPNN